MHLPNPESQCRELSDLIRPKLCEKLLLVGIYSGGGLVAERVRTYLSLPAESIGFLDVSFYRDDYHEKGLRDGVKPSQIPFSVENRHVILIDDVLYTGRTTRAALSEIFDYGRPKTVELAVLADRKGRELPICANYCVWEMPLEAGQKLHLAQDPEGKLFWSVKENA